MPCSAEWVVVQLISLVQHWLPDALELLRSPLGAVAFIPLYALWVTLLLPGVWASMVAGALYGTWIGSGLVFLGACRGAEVVFLLGRSWLREWARRRLQQVPKLQAVEQAVSREGLKLVLLTRLSPAFPFSPCGPRRPRRRSQIRFPFRGQSQPGTFRSYGPRSRWR